LLERKGGPAAALRGGIWPSAALGDLLIQEGGVLRGHGDLPERGSRDKLGLTGSWTRGWKKPDSRDAGERRRRASWGEARGREGWPLRRPLLIPRGHCAHCPGSLGPHHWGGCISLTLQTDIQTPSVHDSMLPAPQLNDQVAP
jgi:hypothetical protein